MGYDAEDILNGAESDRSEIREQVREAAEWFHDREGEMFQRDDAKEQIMDDLGVDNRTAQTLIAELVGDDVDPIVQATMNGTKFVGVAEYHEFEGSYGYLDFHDVLGKRRRVVCAQCVHDADTDANIVHATAGDPHGSFGKGASYDQLQAAIREHYEDAHDVIPGNVETGASLLSGTTIGGNESWHSGNDGDGSGLDAAKVMGTKVYVGSSAPSGATSGDLWVDTSN
jgi:hypothetical protein